MLHFKVINSRNENMAKYAAYTNQGLHIDDKPHCVVMQVEGERPMIVERYSSRITARQIARKRNG